MRCVRISNAAEMERFYGEKGSIGWGHQIRSYVLQPYRMVKDLRTGVQTGQYGRGAGRRPRSLCQRLAPSRLPDEAQARGERTRKNEHSWLGTGERRSLDCVGMGLTVQKLVVKENHRARRKATVNFLVDSGAVYSLVPAATLKGLGIRPHRQVEFALADGTMIRRRVGDAYFEFQGQGGAAR